MYGEQNYGGRCISVLSLGFAGWIQNDCNPSNAQRQWDFVLSECTGEYTTRPFPYVDTRIARHWPTHTVSSTPVWKLSARVHSLNCSILFPFSFLSISLSIEFDFEPLSMHARTAEQWIETPGHYSRVIIRPRNVCFLLSSPSSSPHNYLVWRSEQMNRHPSVVRAFHSTNYYQQNGSVGA